MLNDLRIRALKPADKVYRIHDRDGLYMIVTPSGARSWIYRYKLRGRSGSIGLGSYPDVTLKLARDLRDRADNEVAAGRKPLGLRAQELLASSHGGAPGKTVADLVWEWFQANENRWSPHFREEVRARLQSNVIDKIGHLPAVSVTPVLLLDEVIRPLTQRSHDLAQRCRQHLEAAWGYGMAIGIVKDNPAATVKAALGTAPPKGRRPAIVDLDEVRTMLRRIEAQPSFPQVRLANRFMALTAMRPGEVRFARWEDFRGLSGDNPVWRIPEARMKVKGRGDFLVPLSRQAVEVIEAARSRFAKLQYVFPHTSKGHEPLSENAVGYLINRAGYAGRHCAHGWRSAFRTIAGNRRMEDLEVIKAALAHDNDDNVDAAYNRETYFERRQPLMQAWASLLLADMPPAVSLLDGPIRSAPGRYESTLVAA